MPTYNKANHKRRNREPDTDPLYPPVNYYAQQEKKSQTVATPVQLPCNCLDGICYQPGTPGCWQGRKT